MRKALLDDGLPRLREKVTPAEAAHALQVAEAFAEGYLHLGLDEGITAGVVGLRLAGDEGPDEHRVAPVLVPPHVHGAEQAAVARGLHLEYAVEGELVVRVAHERLTEVALKRKKVLFGQLTGH